MKARATPVPTADRIRPAADPSVNDSPEEVGKAPETLTIFGTCMSLNSRLDTIWQRLIYAHAAIIGVMVFFSTADDAYLVPRVLVFLVYTVNLMVSLVSMREAYQGLQAGLADIRARDRTEGLTHMETWLISLDYSGHQRRRNVVFVLVWVMIAYLLFARFLPGGEAMPGF
ncbi:MAG: hypothetical protein AB3N23_00895 [Paracoccaceae bacterium]